MARQRWASIIFDEVMYSTLGAMYEAGGKRGFTIGDDAVGDVRRQIENWKFEFGPKFYKALLSGF